MTVDCEELRRLSDGITPLGCPPRMDVACRLSAAVPSLLDDLDAADRRIADLQHTAGLLELAVENRDADVADLTLRLSIATELNVGDRKRIAELEALNAAAARAVDVMDDIGEQARARIAALETALTDAINWIADRSSPDSILVDRLRKLVPLEET